MQHTYGKRWTAGLAVIFCAVFLHAGQVRAQALPPDLVSAWRQTGLPQSALSLVVQDVGGARLAAVNAAVPRNPASVMKLVTTWAALSELGPSYTWRTELVADPGAQIQGGVLSGPLYVRAAGDPQLMLQDLWTLLRDLRVRGVREIGDVVVDRGIFGDVATDPGAFDGSPDRAYNASPDAFMVAFGAVRLMFVPDPAERRWRVAMDPPLPHVKIDGTVGWGDGPCQGSPEISTTPVVKARDVTLQLAGTMPGACGEFSLYRLALSQPDQAAAVFRLIWRDLGGTLAGQVRAGQAPADGEVLAVHESPELGETIRTINKRSNNVMARTLLLTLGAERGPRPATVASSDVVARNVLDGQGLSMPELIIDNGAGLAREARVSAESLAALLRKAWLSPYMPEFVSSLAIVGQDGTMKKRLRDRPGQGNAHLKTGSLRDVRAIAGYVQGASGKRYIVVCIVNHEQAAAVRSFDDALVEWLARR
jgi:D-alanyl-D-alanine carboxypeptidase/D-alanyl-D-alanine-endopeptidase (penicillin-binding protein 4)